MYLSYAAATDTWLRPPINELEAYKVCNSNEFGRGRHPKDALMLHSSDIAEAMARIVA